MANNCAPLVTQISECYIKPKQEVEQSKEPYHLAPADIGMLGCHPLQKGLLFNKLAASHDFNINSFLDKLKSAVSWALIYFYPLAGRLCKVVEEEEDVCWLYVDCNKGPGVSFIHGVCGVPTTVADVVASEPHFIPVIRSFFDLGVENLVNIDGLTRPLLSIQVTEIVDGVFIGFTMNHMLVDGSSFWHFVNTLSEIYNSLDGRNEMKKILSNAPIIKPVLPNGYGPITKIPCQFFKEWNTKYRVKVDPHIKEKIFHFSSSSISKLKAQANAECCAQISSFESLIAFVWRSITRVRNLKSDFKTTCMLVADARTRFNPPLSNAHFGNLIVPIQGVCKVGEILQNDLGWAALCLHESIASTVGDKACDRGKGIFELVLKPNNNNEDFSSIVGGECAVVVGGGVRFNVYGPNFGFGRVVAVRTGYAAKTDGKVTATPGTEGQGSVELEISLPSQTLSALQQDQQFMSFVNQI